MSAKFERSKLEELLKKRFFYAPSFSIYGGVAGLYDYGPPGCALQANVINFWRQFFILEEQMLEVDCSILTPHDVLKTSGHVDRFADYMVSDAKTGEFYRADHLLENRLEKMIPKASQQEKEQYENILAQIDGYGMEQLQEMITRFNLKSDNGNDLTPVRMFNLMFGTEIGPTGAFKAFLRPETAQGQFLNFKRLLECNNERMPFASAMIGKSFRNEISPRSGLLRVREFTMAEIEHYVDPCKKDHPKFSKIKDVVLNFLPASTQLEGKSEVVKMTVGQAVQSKMVDNETLGYFLARVSIFLETIGVKKERLRFRQHLKNEMAHYACDCWDAEIHTSYGWIECVGNADRSCYDLTVHAKKTKEKLVVRERLESPIEVTNTKLILNKKDIGIKFKKDAKVITEHLESLETDGLLDLQAKMNTGSYSLILNGQTFELDKSLCSVETVVEVSHVREYIPSVIEPSFGIGRVIYSLLEHVYWVREEDENRGVLSFPPLVAPVKCLLLPLSNSEVFSPFIHEIDGLLREKGISFQTDDSTAAIGKRYARNDEIGIPFAITVDFQTTNDRTVTVRERDSTKQIRIPLQSSASIISDLIYGRVQWQDLSEKYPSFSQQQL